MLEDIDGTSTYNNILQTCIAFPHSYQMMCIKVARFDKALFLLLFAFSLSLFDEVNNIVTTSRGCDTLICNVVSFYLLGLLCDQDNVHIQKENTGLGYY